MSAMNVAFGHALADLCDLQGSRGYIIQHSLQHYQYSHVYIVYLLGQFRDSLSFHVHM